MNNKHTPRTKDPAATGGSPINTPLRMAVALAVAASVSLARGDVFVKANNPDALNLASSWTNNAVPGAADIAQWDNTLGSAANTTNTLGADATWAGIKIVNPAAPVQIDAGNTLTLGSSGIDMSSATMDLTLFNDVTLPDYTAETWSVPSGRTLSLEGALNRAQGGGILELNGNGTVHLSGTTGTDTVLLYALINGTDLGDTDTSTNISTIAAVRGYTQNTAGSTLGAQYVDVVNGNTGSGADVYQNTTIDYPRVIRFNTHRTDRDYWLVDAHRGQISLNKGPTPNTFLFTTNLGANDVDFTSSSGLTIGWRQSSPGSELILFQQNTAGTVYISGNLSEKYVLSGNILTKMGAGRVVINTTLPISGGTRILEGELTLNGSVPNSAVTVNNGATLSGSGTIPNSVDDSGTVWPGDQGAGTLTVGSLALNAGSSLNFYDTAISASTTNAPLNVTNSLTINGPVSVSILAGYTAVGQYPLVQATAAVSSSDFTNFTLAQLPLRTFGYLSNNIANNSIDLVITNVNEPIKWATGNGTWDVATTANWQDTLGASTTYQQIGAVGDKVLFEDTVSGASPIAVNLNTSVTPSGVIVDASKNYTFTGNGDIAGGGSLTKSGSGTLTLQTTNSFSGGLNVNGGVVMFNSLTNLGQGDISFGGGTLLYPAGDTEDLSAHNVTFAAGQSTIDDNGNDLTFANPIGGNGAGGFTKAGSGTLLLSGTNTYTGNTVIASGTLTLNYGATIADSAAIIINSGALLDGYSYGGGLTLAGTPAQILAGNGAISGTVISSNGVIMPGTNGVVGTLTFSNDLTIAGGTVDMDISTDSAQRDLIAVDGGLSIYDGTLHLNIAGTLTNGVYKIMTVTYGLYSGAGSSANLKITGFSQPGQSATLSDSTPGEIDLVVADSASDHLTWSGTGYSWDLNGSMAWLNGSTAWAYTNGDYVTFDDTGSSSPSVSLLTAVLPSSVTVSNNTTDYYFIDGTGTGGGNIGGSTSLVKDGSGTLYLQTANNYSGPTIIKNGTIQVSGDLGTGPVTNNGALDYSQSGDHTQVGKVTGSGSLTQSGTGTLTLKNEASYTGPTTVSGGTLQVGTGGSAGVMATSAITNNGTMILNSSTSWTLNVPDTGSGLLWKQGTNTLTLNGANSRTGETRVESGKLILGGANYLHGSARIEAGGTLDINGFDQTFTGLSGGTYSGRLVNNSGTATNVVTINNSGTSDSDVVIADNDGSGGAISVVKDGAGTLIARAASTYSGGTWIKSGTINMRNSGALGSGLVTFGDGQLTVANGGNVTNPELIDTNGTIYANGNIYLNASISGGSTSVLNISGDASQTVTPQSGCDLTAFNGTVRLPGVNFLFLRFDGSVGGASTTWDLGTNCTVVQRYGNRTTYFGNLTGGDGSTIEGGGGGTTTYIIGGKNQNGTYPGLIQDGGSVVNIVKDGTGTLTLTGTNTWSGSTIVSNGVLALANYAVPATTSEIAVHSGATLDLTGLPGLGIDLGSGAVAQTLTGGGAVNGDVTIGTNAIIAPGTGIGTLTISGALTNDGAAVMELNRTNVQNADSITAGSFSMSGTLTVTNIGPDLVTGDKFQLFSAPVSGFSSVSLPAANAANTISYVWTNKLAIDGSIEVLSGASPINTNPPPIVSSYNGSTLSLSWPTNSGWILQMQTNNLATGLGTNWVDVPGSENITSTNITVNAGQPTVFYRLRLP